METDNTSGNATTGSATLKRIQFKFKDTTYRFILNPESYTQSENGKTRVTKTKGGAFVETFGADIPEIEFSGTTGFKNGTGNPDSGFSKFKELRDLIKTVYENVNDGSPITDEELLWFYNYTDAEYWKTIPDRFELSRNKAQPLLYHYSIHLYCIRKIGEAEPSTEVKTIGSPLGVQDTTEKPQEAPSQEAPDNLDYTEEIAQVEHVCDILNHLHSSKVKGG